jgi:hypothetical protein
MSLNNKPLESITEADLKTLLLNEVPEGKTLEYKQKLPGSSDEERKEFLYDVSAFANASGGDLIYGIKEENGVPVEICGLDILDMDAAILKLQNSIRDGIAPRIPGLRVERITLENERKVIVFRIPRSFLLPHMVTFKKASKFYSRNSAGKYQLDVGELRTAFTLSQNTTDRIRGFRQERLSNIVAEETPVPIKNGPKLVLHLIPISAFDPASILEATSLIKPNLQPLGRVQSCRFRYNFDGLLAFEHLNDTTITRSYVQAFRNGIIEAVKSFTLPIERLIIDPNYEEEVLDALPKYVSVQESYGVEPPLFTMLSLLGVKGYSIKTVTSNFLDEPSYPIERDTLLLPEVIVENFAAEWAKVMKPAFDSVWNAAGFPDSGNYSENGEWVGGSRSV